MIRKFTLCAALALLALLSVWMAVPSLAADTLEAEPVVTAAPLAADAGLAAEPPPDVGSPAPSAAPTTPATIADPDAAPLEFARQVWNAAASGHLALAIVLGLIGLMALLRRFRAAWFASDLAGAVTVLLSTFLLTLATSLGAGHGVQAALLPALGLAAAAMGGYSGMWKRIALPLVQAARLRFGW